MNGSGACFRLKAAAALHDDINISRFYNLSTHGKYRVQLGTLDPGARKDLKSNTVAIIIAP
jgi:hypothetical protein